MITSSVLMIFCTLLVANKSDGIPSSYENMRNSILEEEIKLITGSQLHLNDKEQKVDDLFLKYKQEELLEGYKNLDTNAPGMHIFNAKGFIERSKVFKILKNMPKGASLHLHTTASVSSTWVVQNISYTPGLLRCTKQNGLNILTFRSNSSLHGCVSKYFNINEERSNSRSSATYDRDLEKLINLWTPLPEIEYFTQQRVWNNIQNMFETLSDVQRYLPVFRKYINRMLEEIYEDHIMYAMLRMNFEELYDESGQTYSAENSVQEFTNVVDDFKLKHPNFLGVKVIYATYRSDEDIIRRDMKLFKILHSKYPNLVIGFDFVGQEDKGKTLFNLLDFLSEYSSPLPLILHAGETSYFGGATDINLLDALLLNTTRIGHGYALMKHPIIYNAVKSRNIPIEVSPISNQVLHLLTDLRNHPASLFIAQNMSFVICNDDPGFWNLTGLSYDFYYAIMSLAPNYAGLKLLKRLVWNSLENKSALEKALITLNRDWNHFIDDVLDDANTLQPGEQSVFY